MNKRKARLRRSFGAVKYLPAGKPTRVVVSYPVPVDAYSKWPGLPKRISRSFPIERESEALAYLDQVKREIDADAWEPPKVRENRARTRGITFDEYFPTWLDQRRYRGRRLRPGTLYKMRGDYDHHISPVLGSTPLNRVTQQTVDRFDAGLPDQPAMRRNVMKILTAMLHTASEPGMDGSEPIIPRYPLLHGTVKPKREREIIPATPGQIRLIVASMPEGYGLAVELACAVELRIGEVCALQRGDINVRLKRLHVARTRVTMDGASTIGDPKTASSDRWEPIPDTLMPLVEAHLRERVAAAADAWLFPAVRDVSRPLNPTTLRSWFSKARGKAGREDLRFHDLRHTGLTWLAFEGATLRELMDAGGHSSAEVAMLYQHSVDDRRRQLANRVGERLREDDSRDGLERRIRELDERIRELTVERTRLAALLREIQGEESGRFREGNRRED
ncbi:tyrosine-type recombinase/integrase [Bifidobacterium tissieri]|uniref:tyrosine-type recombinase/integrase n=1 Tax=Bifidobacterium tissieri TaxID=1630162 RepID=UPI00123AAA89|nr:tyrosine-type recombinase/integrase [Bifidobacterium tissieri]KAA8832623.1 hypothetical protein EM849_03730 [Bifidobacterium tissieri]